MLMTLIASFLESVKGGKKCKIDAEWSVSLDSHITSQLSSGYLDEDSVVVGTASGKVRAFSSYGKEKWSFSASKAPGKEEAFFLEDESLGKIKSSPVIADINKDGRGEVIFGTEYGVLYALDCKGKPLWNFKARDEISGSVFVEDINKDGRAEILFGSSDSNFYALTSQGKLLWEFNAGSGIESQPGVTKNGPKKIIFGSNDGTVYALNEKGKKMWEFKAGDKITAQPCIGNLYNDAREFIILGSLDNNLYVLANDGKLCWNYKTEGRIFSKAVLCDLNKDRRNEIVFGSCDDKIHILSDSGKKIWDFETNFWVVPSPIVGDFDDNGQLEVAVGSCDNFVYILEAEGKYALDYMPGISGITGQPGNYTDLPTSEPGCYIGNVLSKYKTDGMIVGSALSSGKSIIAATETGKLYKLKYTGI